MHGSTPCITSIVIHDMSIKKIISLAAVTLSVAATSHTAMGQDLVRVVEAERDIQPQLRVANRPELYPEILRPQPSQSHLTPSLRTREINVDPLAPQLASGALLDTINPRSPWRGYVSGGYFPAGDFQVEAGYALHRGVKSQLRGWVRGSSLTYDAAPAKGAMQQSHDALMGNMGLDYRATVHPNALLRVSTSLLGERYNLAPFHYNESHQGVTDYNLAAAFTSRGHSIWDYALSIDYRYMGMTQMPIHDTWLSQIDINSVPSHGARNNMINIKGIGGWNASETTVLFLEMGWQGSYMPSYTFYADRALKDNLQQGILSVVPGVKFAGKNSTGFIKVRWDISNGATTGGSFLAVDSRWDWKFRKMLTLSGYVLSGSRLNTLAVMQSANPYATVTYLSPAMHHCDLGASLTVGPWRGAWFSANAYMAGARNNISSMIYNGEPMLATEEISSGILAFAAGYNAAPWLQIKASWETAIGGDRINYHWSDKALNVVRLWAQSQPVEQLTVGASWERRSGRRVNTFMQGDFTYIGDDGLPVTLPYLTSGLESLGTVSDLSLWAGWNFTERLGVQARIAGLTQGAYRLPDGIAGRRTRGLLSVTYRF